jgi:hypothetical protein
MTIQGEGGCLWRNKSAEPEKIEGQVWIVENLTIRITKVLTGEEDNKGGLGKTEGSLLEAAIGSARGSFAPISVTGLM